MHPLGIPAKIVIGSSEDDRPSNIHVLERTTNFISIAFSDPEHDDVEFLDALLMAQKPFSVTIDGELIFVIVERIDGETVDLRVDKTTEIKMAIKPN